MAATSKEKSYSVELRSNGQYCYNRSRHDAQNKLSDCIASLYSVSDCPLE